jgi:hypothetical protein
MLAWAAKSETHTVLALFLVALALLLVAGVLDNVLSDTAKQRIQQALRRGAGAIGYGLVRTMLAVGKVLAFFLSESWFYGALADLMAIAAGVAPVVFYIGTAAQGLVAPAQPGASAAAVGPLAAASLPILTVGQTLVVVGLCAVGVVLFRAIAAALAKRKK